MSTATPPSTPVQDTTTTTTTHSSIGDEENQEQELSSQVRAAMTATAILDTLNDQETENTSESKENDDDDDETDLSAQVTAIIAATLVLDDLTSPPVEEEIKVEQKNDDGEEELIAQVTSAIAATAVLEALTEKVEEQIEIVKTDEKLNEESKNTQTVEQKDEIDAQNVNKDSPIIETTHSETTTDSSVKSAKDIGNGACVSVQEGEKEKDEVVDDASDDDDDDDDGIAPNVEAFHLRKGYLHPDTIELAKKELRETPELRASATKELRKLLHAAKDLHYKDDDFFLLIFLRACHFYPESAFEKMRSIASFRKEHANLVHGLMIAQLKQKFVEGKVVNVLKNCDQKGRRVMFVNCGQVWDPSVVPSDDVFRMLYMVHLAAQMEPETQIRGVVCVMDFEGLAMKQVKALSPSFSKRLLTFIQDAMPLRMKEVHFVKQPFIFKMVWQLFKPFVREKLNKRMHFHGSDMKSLHKFLDPAILPANYKGTQPKIDYGGENWWPALEKHEKFVNGWGEQGPAVW